MTLRQKISSGQRRFKNKSYHELDLSNLDAPELVLINCTFHSTTFRGALLDGIETHNCTFIDCNFSFATLTEGVFENTSFYQHDGACTFYEADCRNTYFNACDIRLASFERARLFDVNFHKTNATGASFYRADFNQLATLTDCIFRMVDLRDIKLNGCNCHQTDFEQADLREADFSKCKLTECNFAGAITTHFKIKGADLRGSNITSFDIRQLDFTGVTLYPEQQAMLLDGLGILFVERIQPN